ncbi:MAG: hypothetical protein LQ343_001575 [Gyalolechia ehrenbergii]|nr:MAG: hypothetical protein LQ343_001575 [Gyalolechia ehrenbergii]
MDDAGFDSAVFTITVGHEKHRFTAHATYLSQSPVLDRMCHGHFKESNDSLIDLPDDEPTVIKALIQYLYSGNFLDFGTMESGHGSAGANDQLSDIYVTAEKYQMLDLKDLVVEKLKAVTDVEDRPVEFLTTAQKIYGNVPEERPDVYREYFKKCATQLPKPGSMSKPVYAVWLESLSYGGPLAVDLTIALANMYNEALQDLADSSTENEKLIMQLENTKMNLTWENGDLKKLMSREKEEKRGMAQAAADWKDGHRARGQKIAELQAVVAKERLQHGLLMSRHDAIHGCCKLCGIAQGNEGFDDVNGGGV